MLLPGTWNGEPQGTQLLYLNLPEGLWLPKPSLVVSYCFLPSVVIFLHTYSPKIKHSFLMLQCKGMVGGAPVQGSSLCLRCWAPGALPAHKKTAPGVFSCECLFRDCRIVYGSVPVLYVKLNTRGHVRGAVGHSQGLGSPNDGNQPPSAFSFLSFTPGQRNKHQVRAVVRTFCHLPWHLALWELGDPRLLGLECGRPRQVHKLTFPPPLRFWGQAGSLRPRGRAGPPGGGPPISPPSSWRGPPRAVIG